MPSKYYVVWTGRETGIFNDWASAQRSVDGFAGAKFKSFTSRAEAEQAYRDGKSSLAYPRRTKTAVSVREKSPSYKTTEETSSFDVRIFCDGACEPNPGNAGSGIAVYRHGKLVELWYGLYNPEGTNNTAELNALHQALRMAQTEIDNDHSVEVLTDSMYSINCIRTWAAGWEKKGWKKIGGDIKNLEIIQKAYTLYNEIKDEMQLSHVAGHAGHEGNELADRMAVLAAKSKQHELRRYEGEPNIELLLKMKAG